MGLSAGNPWTEAFAGVFPAVWSQLAEEMGAALGSKFTDNFLKLPFLSVSPSVNHCLLPEPQVPSLCVGTVMNTRVISGAAVSVRLPSNDPCDMLQDRGC